VTQDQAITLAFKIVEIASLVTIAAFTVFYSRWAKWWSNAVGRTIVYEGLAIILILIPSVLSIFVNFNRFDSHIAAWFDIGSFALVPIIMCWRIFVFGKIHRAGRLPQDGGG
jgi:uncharacterized membrane protein YbhN (UPF0104 family)